MQRREERKKGAIPLSQRFIAGCGDFAAGRSSGPREVPDSLLPCFASVFILHQQFFILISLRVLLLCKYISLLFNID